METLQDSGEPSLVTRVNEGALLPLSSVVESSVLPLSLFLRMGIYPSESYPRLLIQLEFFSP
eukprot:scaffold16020_cov21-Tisochrysis_lutea.AAC.1